MDTDTDDVELTLDLEPEPDPDPLTPDTAGDPAAEAFARLEGEMALMRRAVQHLAAERAEIVLHFKEQPLALAGRIEFGARAQRPHRRRIGPRRSTAPYADGRYGSGPGTSACSSRRAR